jgi:hypothetical protein
MCNQYEFDFTDADFQNRVKYYKNLGRKLAAALASHVQVCRSRRQVRARQHSVRAARRHRGLAANSSAALCLRTGAEEACTAAASQPNVRPNVGIFFKSGE